MDELKELEIQVASFTAKVTEWMETTTEYRKKLCDKIDGLKIDFAKLPCKGRIVQSRLMWGAIGIVFGILVAHIGWR